MPLKPCSSGSVPNSEKNDMPQATDTSARKCPDRRAVIRPSSQATPPVTISPASRPLIGGMPASLVSSVVE